MLERGLFTWHCSLGKKTLPPEPNKVAPKSARNLPSPGVRGRRRRFDSFHSPNNEVCSLFFSTPTRKLFLVLSLVVEIVLIRVSLRQGSSISGPRRPNNWPVEQHQNAEEIYYIFLQIHFPILTIYIFTYY